MLSKKGPSAALDAALDPIQVFPEWNREIVHHIHDMRRCDLEIAVVDHVGFDVTAVAARWPWSRHDSARRAEVGAPGRLHKAGTKH